MIRRRKLLILLGGLVLTAVAAFWVRPSSLSPSTRSQPELPAATLPVQPDAPGAVAALDPWRVGETRIYRTAFATSVGLGVDGALPAQESTGLTLHVTGDWELTPFLEEDGALWVTARWPSPTVTMQAGPTGEGGPDPRTAQGLGQPVVLRLHRDGRVVGVRLPADLEASAAAITRAMAAALQHRRPREGERRWTATEQDTLGEYVATYARPDGVRRLVREKKEYRWLIGAEGPRPVDRDLTATSNGAAHYRVDADGALAGLDVVEQTAMDLALFFGADPAQHVRMTSNTRVEARLERTRPGPVEPPAQWRAWSDTPLADAKAARALAGAPANVPVARFADLLPGLSREEEASDPGQRTRRLAALSASLRSDDGAAALVLEAARAGLPPGSLATLIGALGNAGGPVAQETLAALISEPAVPPENQVQALGTLGIVERPTEKTAAAIEALLDDARVHLRRTAAFAAGSVARNLGQAAPDRAASLVDRLVAIYRAAATPEEELLALDALGNTGDARLLPLLEEACAAEHPVVRDAAVRALRFMPPGRADELTRVALASDPYPQIRRSAVFTASFRELSPLLPALAVAARADEAPDVRLDVVRLAAGRLDAYPAIRAVLESAQADPEEQIRTVATRALQM